MTAEKRQKTRRKQAKKNGRPKIKVDIEEVKKLCEILCTRDEIANIIGVSISTLQRRIKEKTGDTFDTLFESRRSSATRQLDAINLSFLRKAHKWLYSWARNT